MLRITVLAVGKLKERYLDEGTAEYLKRLKPYARVDVVEVPDEPFAETSSAAEREKMKAAEGVKILRRLRPGTFLIVLDAAGESPTSRGMAARLDQLALSGRSDISFAIGGALGHSREVLSRAGMLLSFSRFTLPHQLMRLILFEQLYRWFRISRGEPYHY